MILRPRRLVALPIACLAAWAAPAWAVSPAAYYYGESLLCRQKAGAALCELWLDPNGRYTVLYDSGKPGVSATAPRFAGIQGSYSATPADAGTSVCFRPDPGAADATPALFRDAGCVTVPTHPIGETFSLRFGGQDYIMVLAQGR